MLCLSLRGGALQETSDQDATAERVPGTPAPTLPGESPPGPTRRSRRATHPPEVDEEVEAENRLGAPAKD